MRKLLHILLFVSLPFIAISQNIKGDDLKIKEKSRLIGQVTIGSKSFDNSAILTLTATDKGFLISRMTTAQRDAIGSPATGLLIFNTTTNKFEFFETTWQAITDGGDMIGTNNLSDVSNATTSYNNIKQQGTTTFIGAWESGTVAEINTGTDVTKLVTVDGLAGSQLQTDVTTNNAKITNATHTGDVTGSGVLTIAAKAVEISMLDDGTDGELITWDATGVAATVATGTSGQVLTSNGAGAAPTFQTDGGDGDGIYDASGSLSNNPTTVAQGTNKIKFTSTIVDAFSVDGTTFSVDASNNRVGIGTASPSHSLDVSGDGRFTGTLGINTAPVSVSKLTISHNPATDRALTLTTNSTSESNEGFQIINTNNSGVSHAQLSIISDNGNVNGQMFTQGSSAGSFTSNTVNFRALGSASPDFVWITGGTSERMRLTSGGNIGIGLASGINARLTVSGVNAASTSDALFVTDNTGTTPLFIIENAGDIGIGITDPTVSLHVIGDVIIDSVFSIPTQTITLVEFAATFVVQGNKMEITGDGGGNSVTTITGGVNGMTLTLTFVDALVTLTDDNTSTVNTINLPASFTSTANDIVVLEFNGTSWRQVSQSVN